MAATVPALGLPLQMLALGSVVGMTSALTRYARTGATDHWPVHLAVASLAFFWLGVVVALLEALL